MMEVEIDVDHFRFHKVTQKLPRSLVLSTRRLSVRFEQLLGCVYTIEVGINVR